MSGVGHSPFPNHPSLGQPSGPAARFLWARGVQAFGPVTNPTAHTSPSWFCALWGRHKGAQAGGPRAWVRVVRGWALTLPPTDRPWGRRSWPAAGFPCARGLWAWGPVTNHTARALASWLCALWGRDMDFPGGGAHAWVWSVQGRALFPTPLFLHEAGGRGPLPVFRGRGGCGRADPSPTPQRALLRAGFAHCWGSTRAPGGGGASCWGVGRPGLGALPPPAAFHGARGRGPMPVFCLRGGCGRGDRSPTTRRALLRTCFARCGGSTWPPGGGASCVGVRRPGLAALPPPGARPWSRKPGPAARFPWARGIWVWGPFTNPTARALASWLCALWGQYKGARGGERLMTVCGASGVGRPPRPPPPSMGPQAGVRCLFAIGAGGAGVGTGHQPHSARSCQLALRAVVAAHGRPWGGGAPLPSVWSVRGWLLFLPRAPVHVAGGRGPLPVFRGRGGCEREDPSPTPQRALLRAGFAHCVGRHKARGGGACLALVWGVQGWALSLAQPPVHSVHVGSVGVGTLHQPHSARSCELALCTAGAVQGRPAGGASCLGVGRAGLNALTPPAARHWGVQPGPATHWPWEWCAGSGGPVLLGSSSSAAFRRVLCALPGFAATDGRCCLAPGLLPWLWPAACLSCVPRGPGSVRRATSGPVALGALFGFSVAMVPFATPGLSLGMQIRSEFNLNSPNSLQIRSKRKFAANSA